MLFSSVTFGFALFSYAFQTYTKLSEETMKYLQEKTEAATKAAANAAMSEMGDFADKMSITDMMPGQGPILSLADLVQEEALINGIFSYKSDAERITK